MFVGFGVSKQVYTELFCPLEWWLCFHICPLYLSLFQWSIAGGWSIREDSEASKNQEEKEIQQTDCKPAD